MSIKDAGLVKDIDATIQKLWAGYSCEPHRLVVGTEMGAVMFVRGKGAFLVNDHGEVIRRVNKREAFRSWGRLSRARVTRRGNGHQVQGLNRGRGTGQPGG